MFQPAPPGPIFRRWWRRLYWLRADLPWLKLLPWRGTAFHVGHGGIGDELLATCALHELSRRLGRPLVVYARHPVFFAGHPAVGKVLPAHPGIVAAAHRWGRDLRHPCEWQQDLDDDRQLPPATHIAAEAARFAGVTGPVAVRPWLRLTSAELDAARSALPEDRPVVALQSAGTAARYHFANKEWGAENFIAVARQLESRFRLVQLGAADDPPIPGALDFRGLPDFRRTAAVLARSAFFVGQVGFLMHLARAVDCRSVVVYGGRERPDQSGYPCNENVCRVPPCSPCWRKSRCDSGRICLTSIAPSDVLAGVERLLPRLGQPLETAEIVL